MTDEHVDSWAEIRIGAMCSSITEQFPGLPGAERFQLDNDAISQVLISGLISPSVADRARNRLAKRIFAALRNDRTGL